MTKRKAKKKVRKSRTPSEVRALRVATAIREINRVRPQIYNESDYNRLAEQHSGDLIFKVTNQNPDLRELLVNVQDNRRHIRLAQQIVACHTGKALNTIKNDWKKHKPRGFRPEAKSSAHR